VFRRLLSSRPFMGIAVTLAFAFTMLFSYISASPFVLQSQFGLSPQAFSLAFAVNSVAIVTGGQVSARLARRVAPYRLVLVGLCMSSVAALLLLFGAVANLGQWAFLAPLVIVIGSFGVITPNATALALLPHPREAGTASAQLGAVQFAIGALVAPLTGLRVASPAVVMALIIAMAAVGALLVFITQVPRQGEAEHA
jgi:DHA1 family bicyclomycin/chloramphenicol resistance-like MFS transporter